MNKREMKQTTMKYKNTNMKQTYAIYNSIYRQNIHKYETNKNNNNTYLMI